MCFQIQVQNLKDISLVFFAMLQFHGYGFVYQLYQFGSRDSVAYFCLEKQGSK